MESSTSSHPTVLKVPQEMCILVHLDNLCCLRIPGRNVVEKYHLHRLAAPSNLSRPSHQKHGGCPARVKCCQVIFPNEIALFTWIYSGWEGQTCILAACHSRSDAKQRLGAAAAAAASAAASVIAASAASAARSRRVCESCTRARGGDRRPVLLPTKEVGEEPLAAAAADDGRSRSRRSRFISAAVPIAPRTPPLFRFSSCGADLVRAAGAVPGRTRSLLWSAGAVL